jgi:hypothetical protein
MMPDKSPIAVTHATDDFALAKALPFLVTRPLSANSNIAVSNQVPRLTPVQSKS